MKTLLPAALAFLTPLLHSVQPRIIFHEIVNPGPGKHVANLEAYPAMSGEGRVVVYSAEPRGRAVGFVCYQHGRQGTACSAWNSNCRTGGSFTVW